MGLERNLKQQAHVGLRLCWHKPFATFLLSELPPWGRGGVDGVACGNKILSC